MACPLVSAYATFRLQVIMKEKISPQLEGQKIRFIAARNHFKHMILRGLHIANKPQTVSLLGDLADMDSLIADRTWQSWFSSRPPIPKPSKISCLDQYIAQIKAGGQAMRAEGISPDFRHGYFCELVHGGLMAQMLVTTEASNPVHMLMRRAQEYQPASPLHLHFDAMEAAGWHQDYGDVPWSRVAAIAADRVLQLLDDRWSPRSGSVYSGFCSDLTLKWSEADEQQRGEIRRTLAKMRPDPFERLMACGASPDWRRLGVSSDVSHEHAYKLLFAFAADPDFLVKDRLSAWSLDLATSALAMHALAWTDRYNTMALGVPPELQYWVAFHEILFNPDPLEVDHWSITSVMENWPADWSERSPAMLAKASETYANFLGDLGLEPRRICTGLLNVRDERPLVFN